ncbi:hypothetical protein V8J82_03500 [Gymnodinialimonas sp. 2305UL16-5]|uniref:hypothetical protein n=1 Tax=Gymnodinialimonas mytili TaxID=3126503 RepID=UPI0030AF3DD0
MSDHLPGSQMWWIETGLIAASGVALAVWLWDGPILARSDADLRDAAQTAPGPEAQPRSLGELIDAGCITADHLLALREGREVRVFCDLDGAADPPVPRQFQ